MVIINIYVVSVLQNNWIQDSDNLAIFDTIAQFFSISIDITDGADILYWFSAIINVFAFCYINLGVVLFRIECDLCIFFVNCGVVWLAFGEVTLNIFKKLI